MKKIYLFILPALLFAVAVFAQPGAVGNNNISGAPFVCTPLTAPSGFFFQARIQANQSSSLASWEFPANCGYPGDVWRPYFGSGVTFNSTVVPAPGPGNGALYNGGNGGASGTLPATTSGNYYTFNIQNVSAPTNAYMSVLETNYNPVTISAVSNTTPANASNSVLVNCTVSSTPASGEYVYVRYSTDGYVTSALAQFSFTGTTGQALIPCFAGGTVVNYYVMSSNRSAAQIAADILATGSQICYDMLTLNLNNNGGANYSYTQGGATNFGGVYSVPSACYATVSDFVTALNGGTVTAAVTMYAIAGSPTETATAGGISITQTGTVANPIIIQKFGSGSYTIEASPALTPGDLSDAIIKLIGSDYITIDGLTLQENAANTTTTAGTNNMTEWGIALLRSSTTDGAQNNTIQNNIISLNRTYTNTFGIYSNVMHFPAVPTGYSDIVNATTAPNHANKVYGNAISNVNLGINFTGSGTAAFMDVGNDIGGSSSATGNMITNWGGASAASSFIANSILCYGIYVNHQTGENVSWNTLTSAALSGTAVDLAGINKHYFFASPAGSFTSDINNNNISLAHTFSSGFTYAISSTGIQSLSTSTVNINNNHVVNCSLTGAGSSANFIAIHNISECGTLNILGNTVRGTISSATGGSFTAISNVAIVVNAVNINNNIIGNAAGPAITYSVPTSGLINGIYNINAPATASVNINSNSIDRFILVTSASVSFIYNFSAQAPTTNINNNRLGTNTGNLASFAGTQSAVLYSIYNGGVAAGMAASISNNDFTGLTYPAGSTGVQFYINGSNSIGNLTVNNNTFTSLSINSSNSVILIGRSGNMVSGSTYSVNNNSIVGGFTNTAAPGGTMYLGFSSAQSVNGSFVNVTNNNFSNVTVSAGTPVFGWYDLEGVSTSNGPQKTYTGNTLNNINLGTGTFIGIYLSNSGQVTCSNNTITNITTAGNISGIFHSSVNGQGTHSISNNTISNLTSTGGNIVGMIAGGTPVPQLNINNNNIHSFTCATTSGQVVGIDITQGPSVSIYDNNIYNMQGSGNGNPFIFGIRLSTGTLMNVFRNRIYDLRQTGTISGTTTPGVIGVAVIGPTNANVYNNFVADLKAPNSSQTDGIRGISVGAVFANSTYNLYYNSVYINASSTGVNFGTSGVYHMSNITATTGRLTMINNIIVNTSTANGTGVTAAYRRFSTVLTNYAAASDYNLFYAGTPSASRLIFYDGTNSDQTLAVYQARVSTRDANSISAMPAFVSATDLHLSAINNCTLDGTGTPIPGYTADIDNQVRDVAAPDIGADEFTATYNTTLAGIIATGVCENKTVSPSGTTYTTSVCDLIARVVPSGGDPVAGKVNVCVTLDAGPQIFNGDPYVQRHFDVEPATSNQTTTSATITLYFTDSEFALYNSTYPAYPPLPTNGLGNTVANRNNVKVTQFHGLPTILPSSPGNYTGVRELIIPGEANVFWNGNFWEVTISVSGFSGFYLHTNNFNAPLPIIVNYLNGRRQGSNHLLDWKVTCNSTPGATMTLERSSDSRNYSGINTITADAARCQQPFDYTDTDPLKGMNYYRLKVVDADGKITYSTTVALLNAVKGFDIIHIAPNPVVSNNFKLNVASAQPGNMEISIFDMQGRLVNRQALSLIGGYNSIPVNVANLAPGTYTIKGSMADDRSKVIRFVKQ